MNNEIKQIPYIGDSYNNKQQYVNMLAIKN